MAYTVELLALIEEFPGAFTIPDLSQLEPASSQANQSSNSENTDPLLGLIEEFPEAFQTPEQDETSVQTASTEIEASPAPITKIMHQNTVSEDFTPVVPAGYEMALHKQISTFTWGKIDIFLRYDAGRLSSLWITVGKSGTEVQSLCEAIARLINLLLSQGIPTLDIVKEIRGIRGGDSEGLGPHRFLGLVDLIGKVLQEAPASVSAPAAKANADRSLQVEPQPLDTLQPQGSKSASVTTAVLPADEPVVAADEQTWLNLSSQIASASVCPDCGSELQQVNGCSGGACVVCGYSSCS